MTDETLEQKKLALELERLQIEKARFASEQRFFQKNMGTLVAAIISLSAVLVSGTQVWITYSTQASESRKLEEERERRWRLDQTQFVFQHMDRIFSGDRKSVERARDVMVVTFSK